MTPRPRTDARIRGESSRAGPQRRVAPRRPLPVPADLAATLNKKAAAAGEAFSYSHRKEYLDRNTEAKRPETRAERLATTLERLAAGKARNWRYERC